MKDQDGFYRLRPEWIALADTKNIFGMATAMYSDLKHHYYNGTFIPPEAIKDLMNTVKAVLHSDHEWSDEEVKALEDKFTELNQFYLSETVKEDIPEVLRAALPQLMKSGMTVVPGNIQPGMIPVPGNIQPGMGQVHMEFVRHKPKKKRRWDAVKIVVGAIFKTVVVWLAILGLLVLIGL